jgi:hypothetical protein
MFFTPEFLAVAKRASSVAFTEVELAPPFVPQPKSHAQLYQGRLAPWRYHSPPPHGTRELTEEELGGVVGVEVGTAGAGVVGLAVPVAVGAAEPVFVGVEVGAAAVGVEVGAEVVGLAAGEPPADSARAQIVMSFAKNGPLNQLSAFDMRMSTEVAPWRTGTK